MDHGKIRKSTVQFGAMVERIAPYDTGNARRSLQKGEKLADRINDQLADIGKRPKLVR